MIVLLTALQREYQAVRRRVTEEKVHRHPAGTLFTVGTLAGRPIALAVLGEGNTSAAALTERAITEFRPAAVLFVGIAGALRDWLQLGDVVVATRVYGYHGGTSEDHGFRARPRAWDAAHHLEQVARHVEGDGGWWPEAEPRSRRPDVVFAPVAAGEVVLDSTSSAAAVQLREHYADAVAIEMESAGAAKASQLHRATPMITIRSISDHARGDKWVTDRTGAPQVAADNAAAFAAAVVARLDPEADADSAERRPPKGHTVTNTASGHANVVAQIGVVHGPVQFGTADRREGRS
ncbi:5'-methylthioadenosine/S-adenosylhomocysteine nucleosidase family protein [Actinophytocola xanthii]|uniref:Nucleoside phosphorylase domain-containing protein n=1 Tax=Actinophytocola xanthii TaxID=1912961 RepID=A0A1Q8C7P0_9PSEU|nr:5'-methylthioadenosine/S-adenosylhomocysteine nucleosidase [Actinophytocola xanthii]OLF10385.1 hypothetical protein BU204_31795 [Actinophytocola xanthii]